MRGTWEKKRIPIFLLKKKESKKNASFRLADEISIMNVEVNQTAYT